MESPYQFSPLRTRGAIRLLELSSGDFSHPEIHINLINTNLRALGSEFEALSYVWGSETLDELVFCGASRSRLYITANCHSALRRLRYRDKPRMLWVDSICINQSDIPERNEQVKIMGRIFAAARRTVVYLGESDRGSDLLFQHLTRTETLRAIDDLLIPAPPRAIVDQLSDLLNRPWFTRIWVVQEVFNSKRTVFLCGENEASKSVVRDCLYGHGNCTRVIFEFAPPIDICDPHSRSLLEDCTNAAQEMYILTAMTVQSESNDPRDRILALTPLVKFQELRLTRLIDYGEDVDTLFEKFSLFLMSSVKLLLLFMIRHPHSRNLPSWVPDWNHNIPLSRKFWVMPDYFIAVNKYNACSDFTLGQVCQLLLDKTQSRRTLTVKGMRYGRINEIGPIIGASRKFSPERENTVHELITTLDYLRLGGTLDPWPDSIRAGKCRVGDTFTAMAERSA